MDDLQKRQNSPCNLLSIEENNRIFDMLGFKCFAMASAVVQVFLTEMKTNHSQWAKKWCGVACFIRDCIRKSYFIRVFNLEKAMCVWEQEIYNVFVYKSSCSFFHTFEADNCMAGLNFADNEEASNFESTIHKLLQERQQKKMERKRQQMNQPTNSGVVSSQKFKSEPSLSMTSAKEEKQSKNKKKKKKRFTKEDISGPTDFVHHQHIGWNAERGFEVTAADPALLEFFSLAGVSEKDLNDNDTRKFIYEFIDDHGGVEAAKQEAISRNKPSLPTRETSLSPNHQPSIRAAPPPPPLPPSQPPSSLRSPSSAMSRSPQPNHGKAPSPPARVFHHQQQQPQQRFPGPPSGQGAPPPPPPPPLPPQMPSMTNAMVPPPPPPPMHDGGSVGAIKREMPAPPDSRSALLEQIRKGKSLHHVEVNGSSTGSVSERGALLNQIRRGIELKPVANDHRSSSPTPPLHGLAEALARALEERNKAVHQTDESDSAEEEEENYDDEWED